MSSSRHRDAEWTGAPDPLLGPLGRASAAGSSASVTTVLVALAANVLVAVAKTIAATITGSASILAEAAHSWADTGNEVFLLVANRRSRRPPDVGEPATLEKKESLMSTPGPTVDTEALARLRAGPALGARPGAERAGLLRRPRRAEPLLDHRRHLPVRVPDDLGRRRAARRAADDRQQHPARGRRDRRRERRQQQGRVPHLLAPPRRPRRRVVAVRQERHPHRARGDAPAAAARRRPGQAAERGDVQRPPHARDRRRADRPGLARRQPLARQHRHPPARPRHADADRHRQPGLGADLPSQPDRGHPRLHRGAGERARLLVEALHRRPPRPARHARRRDAAPAVHGRHRRELEEGDRQRRPDAATS